MEDRNLILALGFIQEEPKAAAKILEQTSLESVAEFISSIPVNYLILIMSNLIPTFSARLCLHLGDKKAATLLSSLDVNVITKILRLMSKEHRDSILAGMPKNKREASKLLMRFSLHSVGAWMIPHTAVISREFEAREVLKYLKSTQENIVTEYIYVVDREGILEGRVSYPELLRAPPAMKIAELIDNDTPHVSVNMLLEQAAALVEWQETDVLAVTDKKGQLLGLLRQLDLRKGLSQTDHVAFKEPEGANPITGIFEVYGKSLLVLLNTVSNAIETDLKL